MKQTAFLPPAQVPVAVAVAKMPDPAWLDSLSPGAGDPVRARHAVLTEAWDALADLEACRPGGERWRAALKADGDAAIAGRAPKTWECEQLLTGDPARWARSSALVRTVTVRAGAALAPLHADTALAAAARTRLDETRAPLVDLAAAEWAAARDDDPATAWPLHNQILGIVDEGARLLALVTWLSDVDVDYDPQGWTGAVWPTRQAQGEHLAAGLLLRGDRMIGLPRGIPWPADFDPGAARVVIDATTGLVPSAPEGPRYNWV